MPNVIVKDEKVHERTFNDKQGRPQIFREQRAAIDLGDGYEQPFLFGLGSGPVYPVGTYDIAPECFATNRYGSLELGRVKLVPRRAPVPAVPVAPGKGG